MSRAIYRLILAALYVYLYMPRNLSFVGMFAALAREAVCGALRWLRYARVRNVVELPVFAVLECIALMVQLTSVRVRHLVLHALVFREVSLDARFRAGIARLRAGVARHCETSGVAESV